MSIKLHGLRKTRNLSLETPLLVPSFSSRGFPGLAEMIEAIRVDVFDSCLVSAHDVVKGLCPENFETLANILIIDSGMYECGPMLVAADGYMNEPSGSEWSRDSYRDFLRRIVDRCGSTNMIIVSYDTYASLQEQVSAAKEDFQAVSGAATDFLLKPEKQGTSHNEFSFENVDLTQFDIIGVTERELGSSAIERCRTLTKLRSALTKAGITSPIHVFGAITPAAVTAYYLCGADIFDGLNWLRASFDHAWGGAISEFAVTYSLATLDDCDVQLELWRRNLRVLRRTQAALRKCAEEGRVDSLIESLPFARASLDLAAAAVVAEGGTDE